MVEIDLSIDLELRDRIKLNSSHINLINDRIVERIRIRYSVNDEIKILRGKPSTDFDTYNSYIEGCVSWGRDEKAKLGL